ncbi:hypothetical protein YC2023_065410 [Brassica napus]
MVFCRRAGDLSLEDEAEALFVTVGEVSLVGSMVKDSEAGATATVLSDLEIRATVPDLVSGSAEVAAATPVVEGVSTLEVVGVERMCQTCIFGMEYCYVKTIKLGCSNDALLCNVLWKQRSPIERNPYRPHLLPTNFRFILLFDGDVVHIPYRSRGIYRFS